MCAVTVGNVCLNVPYPLLYYYNTSILVVWYNYTVLHNKRKLVKVKYITLGLYPSVKFTIHVHIE